MHQRRLQTRAPRSYGIETMPSSPRDIADRRICPRQSLASRPAQPARKPRGIRTQHYRPPSAGAAPPHATNSPCDPPGSPLRSTPLALPRNSGEGNQMQDTIADAGAALGAELGADMGADAGAKSPARPPPALERWLTGPRFGPLPGARRQPQATGPLVRVLPAEDRRIGTIALVVHPPAGTTPSRASSRSPTAPAAPPRRAPTPPSPAS